MSEQEELAERRLDRLISHLPGWMARRVHWLRRPATRWFRLPVALLCVLGGMLFFLPVLGLWMLPLGILLLVEDLPFLRRGVYRLVNWLAWRRPNWFR